MILKASGLARQWIRGPNGLRYTPFLDDVTPEQLTPPRTLAREKRRASRGAYKGVVDTPRKEEAMLFPEDEEDEMEVEEAVEVEEASEVISQDDADRRSKMEEPADEEPADEEASNPPERAEDSDGSLEYLDERDVAQKFVNVANQSHEEGGSEADKNRDRRMAESSDAVGEIKVDGKEDNNLRPTDVQEEANFAQEEIQEIQVDEDLEEAGEGGFEEDRTQEPQGLESSDEEQEQADFLPGPPVRSSSPASWGSSEDEILVYGEEADFDTLEDIMGKGYVKIRTAQLYSPFLESMNE
ncbi:hypothetical protein EW146_g9350 [Bondarzewia mesenterica]|uniref:Uncharacterized protein n=1 Tax=Bondarzewia mesenterica TaxID=1095465 RepID=A0A4S4L732_9AGAM|nr:hypothetical protein EW146_g9350 [Bondarzewia mesenterica]